MERGVLWFICAAVGDPVRPVVRKPAVLGWEAKNRTIELVIERPPYAEELLRRMKGWFTVDVHQVIEVIRPLGKLKILDEKDLVVETENQQEMDAVSAALAKHFGDKAWIEPVAKTRLE